MAKTSLTFIHARASDYRGTASMDTRNVLARLENFITGMAGGSYGATSVQISQDPASATVTLSGVGGTASTGTVTLTDVGGTAASGAVALSGVGGTAATGSVALSGVGGTSATGTVTLAGGADDVDVTIDGVSLDAPVPADVDDDATAIDVASAITAKGTFGTVVVTAAAVGAVVTITVTAKGTAGNVTLSATAAVGTATPSGATLTGGAQGSVGVTLNGTLVTTDTTNLSDTAAATAVAAEIELNGTLGPLVAATGDAADVELVWSAKGTAGNVTLSATSATGTATRSAATLTGGAQGAVTVVIAGTSIGPTDVTDLTDSAAATAVAAAIELNGTIGPQLVATGDAADVELVWSTKGTVGNAVTLSATTLTGTATRSAATLTLGAQGSVAVTVGGTLVTTDTTNLSDTASATAIAAGLDGNPTVFALVDSIGASNVVTLTAQAKGTGGDAITLVSTTNTGTAVRSAATLTGGAAGSVTVTVNGTGEATTTTNLTDEASATLVAAEVNANTTINDFITASASGAVVTIESLAAGELGNTITLTSTSATGTATSSGSKLSGGTSNTYTF